VRNQVEEVLESLDDREAEVLRLYFGLGDEEPLTLEEIGVRFNLTRERVRQIKEKALRRLRHPRRRSALEPLMEVI
jgi:RNA polymerase primary sigma factor